MPICAQIVSAMAVASVLGILILWKTLVKGFAKSAIENTQKKLKRKPRSNTINGLKNKIIMPAMEREFKMS